MTAGRADHLLGIDIGAGSVKTMLVRADGEVGASASFELTTAYPHAGWSEQNPDDWYRGFCATVGEVLQKSGVEPGAIAGISLCAGAHTPVLLDADHKPLRPAILWNDQRSWKEAARLDEQYGDDIMRIGFQRVSPTWTLPQLLWIKENEPEVAARARRLLVAKDYLRWRITGAFHCDRVDAMGTLLCDARTMSWSQDLCAMIDWDPATLPEIVLPTDRVGAVTEQAARDSGLTVGTPVVAGSSDTAAETFGAGATEPGQSLVKLATAATVNLVSDRPHPDRTVINYCHVVPDRWYVIAATNSCASAHRWLRDQLFHGRDAGYPEMDRAAGGIAVGSDGLLFHPYLLGERSPYWDPQLRAAFVGLTMRHQRGHMVRALYEGVAFSLRDCLRAFEQMGLEFEDTRIVGGGSSSALWRQIVANVLDKPIAKPRHDDAAFGAALIAGLGVGLFADAREAAAKAVTIEASHEVEDAASQTYRELFAIFRDAKEALTDINHRLSAAFA